VVLLEERLLEEVLVLPTPVGAGLVFFEVAQVVRGTEGVQRCLGMRRTCIFRVILSRDGVHNGHRMWHG
jgi:hypothetical protein